MLPSQLTSVSSRSFSCGTGLRALTACLRIPDWPRRLGPNFAPIIAGRPQSAACPPYWESPMGNAKLHRILSFSMRSHSLPFEEGRHLNQPRASRVCNFCSTGGLGDERHTGYVAQVLCLGRSQVAILFTLTVLFQRHEAAPLGQGPA